MNLQDRLPRPGTPLRESHPATPEAGQYNSSDVDDPEEDQEDLTSQADLDSEDEYTDTTGHSGRSLPAERNRRRNRSMQREKARAKRNFC